MTRSRSVAGAVAVLLTTSGWAVADTFHQPEPIRWGASTTEIERQLEGKCANGLVVRPIDPPFLPAVETAQVQVDCDGFEFMGAPRWAEFVIGDDRLQMVWIMVEKEDQEAIVAAMTAALGAPASENDKYIAYPQARTAWRFEPPEVLFYAEELDSGILPYFEPDEP